MGEIACVALRSLAMEFKHSFRNVCAVTGISFDTLHLVGGGIQNKLLCQWTCDAVGVPVVAGPTETTSVGNLLSQMKADGKIKDMKQGRELCRNSYQVQTYQPDAAELWEKQYPAYEKLKENRGRQ